MSCRSFYCIELWYINSSRGSSHRLVEEWTTDLNDPCMHACHVVHFPHGVSMNACRCVGVPVHIIDSCSSLLDWRVLSLRKLFTSTLIITHKQMNHVSQLMNSLLHYPSAYSPTITCVANSIYEYIYSPCLTDKSVFWFFGHNHKSILVCEVVTNHVDLWVINANETDIPLSCNVCLFILVVDKCNLFLIFKKNKPVPS